MGVSRTAEGGTVTIPDKAFPIHVTEPDTGIIHCLMGVHMLCNKPCASWSVIVGGVWDCPECQTVWDRAWDEQREAP